MAAKASMEAFNLEERLQECRTTYKLNVGCAVLLQASTLAFGHAGLRWFWFMMTTDTF